MTVQCIVCSRTFTDANFAASISGSIMGDEHTDTYYLCPVCHVYTVVNYWDNFTGVESSQLSGPISLERGNELVALIRQCTEPWNKKCRCTAHRTYFNNTLD
ncbi:MAG: hypothetical protein JW902_00110 [Syntrophaceae bacterium]|nr:hypothetical protein [Syntrophaceae bacterium]